MNDLLKAPFPYFGGKSQVAPRVWELFGEVRNYVEPFAGSLSVLLGRPAPVTGPETVNDFSCHLVNAWRAIQANPEGLAVLLIGPVAEVNTEAQHAELMRQTGTLRTDLGDPFHFDLNLAAFYIKGANEWIGPGWCGGEGPWSWTKENGWAKQRKPSFAGEGSAGKGINRKLPHLGDAGKGINRQLPHLGNAGTGINRQLPHLGNAGKGINRQLPHLGDAGKGINRQLPHLGNAGKGGEYEQRVEWITSWLCALRDRLCQVRIACGDFERVLGESATVKNGLTAVFLDPPYAGTEYVYGTSVPVSKRVNDWCIANGSNPKLRIILAGRGTEHDNLGWAKESWSARRGYANTEARHSECLWISSSIRPLDALLE
jgi:hypothetical protein